MKLVRFGPPGLEKPGLLDAAGNIRDVSGLLDDFSPRTLSPEALDVLRALDLERLPTVDGSPRLGVPWSGMGKYVAIGLNFSDHAAESGMALPQEPTMFTKWLSCVCGPNDDTVMPQDATKLDWEVELGIVIGERTFHVSEAEALDHVAGFCLVNDVSERAYQIEYEGQWTKGKSYPTHCPIGPWLVTPDELGNPQAVDLWLDVNGVRRQTGSTKTMIFGVAQIVSYLSRFMALQPGDVIPTGTPPGVGMGQKPPVYLKSGDVITLGGHGLGEQRQVVVEAPLRR